MRNKLNVLITGQEMHTIKAPLATLAGSDCITVDVVALNSDRLLQKVGRFKPHVVLFSAAFYDSTIIDHICLVKKTLPDVKTMLIMTTYDKRFIIDGLIEGVDGFLLHDGDAGPKHLLKNIHDLYQNGYVLSSGIVRHVTHQVEIQKTKKLMREKLHTYGITVTNRELDTLYLLMENYSNPEIASLLGVKEKSVREYVSNAYSKIGIYKRNQAIAFLKRILCPPIEQSAAL